MIKSSDYKPYFAPIFGCIDFLIIIFSGYLAHWIHLGTSTLTPPYVALIFGLALYTLFTLTITGVYNSWRGRSIFSLLRRYQLAILFSFFFFIAFLFFAKLSSQFSRAWFIYFFVAACFVGTLFRIAVYLFFKSIRTKGHNLHRVMVLSTNPTLGNDFLNSTQENGYQVLEVIPVNENDERFNEAYLLNTAKGLSINEIWICVPIRMGEMIKKIVYLLRHQSINVRYLPDFEDMQLLNHKISNIGGRFALDISCSPLDGSNFIVKRLEDIVVASVILILILPLCLIIAVLIKITSPGPILFKQYRNGINGKKIKVYKFRTMHANNEDDGQVTQASKNDYRITKLGSFLRKTSLDELPQFFNVLQGRMSVVGPRPHALVHNEYYKDLVESYMWRHKVKPGITGLAQIKGLRGKTDTLDKMQARVECDLDYINSWSIWLDLKIILTTIIKGFINKNAY